METIKKRAESLLVALERKITSREDTYYRRTDDWQDSDRGVEYECLTETLEEACEAIRDLLDEINNQ